MRRSAMSAALGVLGPPPTGADRVDHRHVEHRTELDGQHHRGIDAVEATSHPRPGYRHQRRRPVAHRTDQPGETVGKWKNRNPEPLVFDAMDEAAGGSFVEVAGANQEATDDAIGCRNKRGATPRAQLEGS